MINLERFVHASRNYKQIRVPHSARCSRCSRIAAVTFLWKEIDNKKPTEPPEQKFCLYHANVRWDQLSRQYEEDKLNKSLVFDYLTMDDIRGFSR